MTTQHVPISHRGPYRFLGTALGARGAAVDLLADEVVVGYGPWFRSRFPRAAIAAVARDDRRTVSRGVHGWRGRWLVNGAGTGLVRIELDPPQHARTLGVRVTLRELVVSVDAPDELVAALRR